MAQTVEDLIELIDLLAEKNEVVPIIVEGRNDIYGLRSLGFKGEIHSLNHGKSLLQRVEEISAFSREIIVLPDFDRKGVALKDTVKRYVEGMGKTADTYYWNRIRSFSLVSCIEDLPKAIERGIVSSGKGKSIKRYTILPGIGIKR
ncbi:MAG: toprim domain-containing protein [Thermoplasmata archaeon]